MSRSNRSRWKQILAVLVMGLTSLSCTWSLLDFNQLFGQPTNEPGPPAEVTPNAPPVAMAEMTFNVSIPVALNPGESLAIGIVDEVTGLGLNPVMYAMNPVNAQQFTLKLPVAMNSIVKYRYYRQGSIPSSEDTVFGSSVRYRIVDVKGPGSVDDRVASWSDIPFSGSFGKISGTVTEESSGRPIPNILVTAGGVSVLSDSLGQYNLDGLPVGVHWLAAYALDGAYITFQQGAAVADGMVTIAPITLKALPSVEVKFTVSVPADTVAGAPVRLAGNLLQLGNTFADLNSGFNTLASRMPVLTLGQDGKYSVTLHLPVGADVRYKYTLGDGFWNAEHASDASFLVRQLIVPGNNLVVQDSVTNWQAGNQSAPILFDVNVPANTPVGETISIQFNPFGWTEPLPMWPLGNNRWVYKLYGPLNMLGSFQYRYCRSDQCGSADDIQTSGPDAQGRTVSTSLMGENIQESVNGWAWWAEADPGALVAVPVNPRAGAFWAGVEFSSNYSPTWDATLPGAMQNIKGLGANYVVLTPSWTARRASPLVFAPFPGSDPLWNDVLQSVQVGRANSQNIAIFAKANLLPARDEFWMNAPRTTEWWNDWFDRYRAFALYHADLATTSGAQALILGGEEILPALPGGLLADGSPSNVPADAEARWRTIISEVQQHYSGLLLWAHPYHGSPIGAAPAFINQFYAVYLLWSAPLSDGSDLSVETMANNAVAMLDKDIVPFLLTIQKGVVLALDYPSAQGAASGCVSAGENSCLNWSALARPNSDVATVNIDLSGQAVLYQAMLQATNQRDWVGGFISRGYYPPLALMDKSASIRGKPAADLLWYWFPRMTGVTK